jgi:aminoglycoside 6'-N-acetyltransferase I
MKNPFSIRPVEKADHDEYVRMLRALYPGEADADLTPPVDAFMSGTPIDEHIPSAVLVCESDDTLCGFIEVSIRDYAEGCTGKTPFVESWYVDEHARGQGIARALMQAAEEWARSRGFTEIASNARLDNTTSHRAHIGVGFEEVERTVNFRKGL